jgi:hypothetical protein
MFRSGQEIPYNFVVITIITNRSQRSEPCQNIVTWFFPLKSTMSLLSHTTPILGVGVIERSMGSDTGHAGAQGERGVCDSS